MKAEGPECNSGAGEKWNLTGSHCDCAEKTGQSCSSENLNSPAPSTLLKKLINQLILGWAGSSLLCTGFLQLPGVGQALVVVHGLLVVVASPVVEYGPHGAWASVAAVLSLVASLHGGSSWTRD